MINAAIARTELMDWQDEMRERAFDARSALADTIEKEKAMDWKQELYTAGEGIAVDILPELRAALVQFAAALADAEDELAVVQAKAEAATIEAAGGEKALGSNVEARKRALLIALSDDLPYAMSLDKVRTLRSDMRKGEMLVKNRQDQLGFIKAALYAHSSIG